MRYAPCELIAVFEILRGRVAPPFFQTSLERGLRAIRAHPLLNPTALAEGWREWLRSYPVDPAHEPHLVAAIEWLVRAQDATPGAGRSPGYQLVPHSHYGRQRRPPSYPVPTRYIIPTPYTAAQGRGRPE